MIKQQHKKLIALVLGTVAIVSLSANAAFARDIEYKNGEVSVFVTPGEPTQIQFPGKITGGFKKQQSSLNLDKKETDLIVFATEGLRDRGEAIIVRLDDGRSYSVRIRLSDNTNPRDDVVSIDDDRSRLVSSDDNFDPTKEKNFKYAPSTTVSGLMREMVLAAEFGKQGISGYRVSERYKGETVISDGTMIAKIDKIFIGPSLWGYVLSTENLLDQTQQLNPATFRLDGTRAISASNWELAPRSLNIEQQIA
ncbi:MAG: hypothetical protein KDD62_07765, partial [Bdellovibrionales bacterium]|nr:hypothetical protein [Bdellovibrionales bacterium]